MKHSESINEISAAMAKAQARMTVAVKDSKNPHFKSSYADLASVVDAVRGPLTDNGIAFTQWPEAADGGVSIVTMLSHSSGQWMSGETFVPVSKIDAQGYGSAITYGKRYGLQSVCGLPSDDDDGNAATKAAPPAAPKLTPTSGLWEQLNHEEQAFLQGIANEVTRLIAADDTAAAASYINDQRLGADEKAALWTRFNSAERSALKKLNELKKAA